MMKLVKRTFDTVLGLCLEGVQVAEASDQDVLDAYAKIPKDVRDLDATMRAAKDAGKNVADEVFREDTAASMSFGVDHAKGADRTAIYSKWWDYVVDVDAVKRAVEKLGEGGGTKVEGAVLVPPDLPVLPECAPGHERAIERFQESLAKGYDVATLRWRVEQLEAREAVWKEKLAILEQRATAFDDAKISCHMVCLNDKDFVVALEKLASDASRADRCEEEVAQKDSRIQELEAAVERASADREDRTNLREAYQKMHDERDACLDALSEHVSPDVTVTTPRMVRPSSLLAGIRSLQARLRDARSDLREHDAALEAAVERRSEEADASTEQARAILNAVPGEDIVSAARRTMASLARSVEKGEALRYDLSTIVDEAFGMQPVMTHEELLSFLEDKVKERGRDLTAARDRIAELEAPLPEATVEELVRAYRAGSGGFSGQANVFMNGGIRAVAERVRRERCLIARAVAANIDVRVAEDHGGGFLVAAHRPGEDEAVVRNVPAAEVPATLARMLTEVGA